MPNPSPSLPRAALVLAAAVLVVSPLGVTTTGDVFVGSEGEDLAWRYIDPGQAWTTITHANIDDDPLDEIIAGSSDAIWAFDDGQHMVDTSDGPKPEVLWREQIGLVYKLSVTDFEGDGRHEVVAHVLRGAGGTFCTLTDWVPEIRVLDAQTGAPITGYIGKPWIDPVGQPENPVQLSERSDWVLEDVNGDGVRDIAGVLFSSNMDTRFFHGAFAIDGATLLDNPIPGGLVSVGEEALLWTFDTNDAMGPGLERRNIGVIPTPEPDHELVVFSTPSGTFAVNGATGEQVWRDGDIWARAFGVGDVDGDGEVEVVKPNRGIQVIDGLTGETERLHPYPDGTGGMRLGIELADVDRDGVLDIVGIFDDGSPDANQRDDLVVAMNARTGETFWVVDLGPETENDILSAMPHAFDVTGDGFPEIVVGQNEGPWHPAIDNNNNDPPRILVIDAERGVVLWEQVFYDKNRYEITVANHDGDAPYEILNVGHFFLTAWEPTLEDRGTSAIPDDTSDGLGADLGFCS